MNKFIGAVAASLGGVEGAALVPDANPKCTDLQHFAEVSKDMAVLYLIDLAASVELENDKQNADLKQQWKTANLNYRQRSKQVYAEFVGCSRPEFDALLASLPDSDLTTQEIAEATSLWKACLGVASENVGPWRFDQEGRFYKK